MSVLDIIRRNKFDGKTYNEERDGERLTKQIDRVEWYMKDGKWRTLREIATVVGGSESSVSARLRDLRKERFGSRNVERRYAGNGIWEYRLA